MLLRVALIYPKHIIFYILRRLSYLRDRQRWGLIWYIDWFELLKVQPMIDKPSLNEA